MIKLDKVSKFYYQDGVIAQGFSNVSLELFMGEFVVIVGESGSGKSTLLNVISGLDTYDEGEMYINGEETSHYNEIDYLEYRKKYVTNIFQNFNLINSYTVYQNIELALLFDNYPKDKLKQRVNELIDMVNLTKWKNVKASKLSGGQKQRVAIARALAYDTPIIVCDEPTASIDSKQGKEIIKLLKDISKDKLVIIVTHNIEEVEKYASRIITMKDGTLKQNKVINKINEDKNLVLNEKESITVLNKIKLGIRNTFNIKVKFILLMIIFFFISFFFTYEYASLKSSSDEDIVGGSSTYFYYDNKRIIVNKNDKSIINNNDINIIKNIDNIDNIITDDILLESSIDVSNDLYYLYGNCYNINMVKELSYGRLPSSDNEIVVELSKDILFTSVDELISDDYIINLLNNKKVKIVGVIFNDELFFDSKIYVTDNLYNDIIKRIKINYNNTSININNNKINNIYNVYTSDKLNNGEILINNDYSLYCKNYNCNNENININVKNVYYELNNNLKVKEVLNKNNFYRLTGIKYNDDYINSIFISNEDFNNLYNNGIYQLSVFVDDTINVDKISNILNEYGYNTLSIKDININNNSGISEILNIIKLITCIILLTGLFFISYFVIKLIIKSRNGYFATIRSLGCTKKDSRSILMYELINVAIISYTLFMLINIFILNNIDGFRSILKYVGCFEYICILLLVILMSTLISLRYSRKIFKTSVIKLYGEKI